MMLNGFLSRFSARNVKIRLWQDSTFETIGIDWHQLRVYTWNLSLAINSKEDYVDPNLTLHTPVMAI